VLESFPGAQTESVLPELDLDREAGSSSHCKFLEGHFRDPNQFGSLIGSRLELPDIELGRTQFDLQFSGFPKIIPVLTSVQRLA